MLLGNGAQSFKKDWFKKLINSKQQYLKTRSLVYTNVVMIEVAGGKLLLLLLLLLLLFKQLILKILCFKFPGTLFGETECAMPDAF